jgi:cellulose synthase/poly-beta-1,6-N-acetylglucosamine synthase-like glycosyltransferase
MEAIFWSCAGIVAVTYVGYPILIWAVAHWRRRPPFVAVTAPQVVSVVLVVRNENARIPGRIDNLLQQVPAGIVGEIIVVSDGSDDGTVETVRGMAGVDPRIRLIALPGHHGKASGINTGVSAAKNDVIVFADARQDFLPETVARLVARFDDPAVGAVSGELRFRADGSSGRIAESLGLYWRYETWIRRHEAMFDSVTGCPGAIYAVRKSLATPVPAGLILDDVWTPMHVIMQGRRVVYEDSAIALDYPSATLDGEFSRKVRTLAGNFQIVRAEPRILSPTSCRAWWMFIMHKLMRLIVPYAMVGLLVSSLLLAHPFYRFLLGGQVVFLALGWLGRPRGGQNKAGCRICGAINVFLSLNVAAVMALVVYATGRAHTLWARGSMSASAK